MSQMFEKMFASAWERLSGKDPTAISKFGRICYEDNKFRLKSLGRDIEIDFRKKTVTGAFGEWHELVILHYLDLADGTELSGQMISFAAQRDGMIRGGEFDRRSGKKLAEVLGILSEDEIRRRCLELDAAFVDSNADICAVFSFLPCYPITFKMWFADEEMPASCRLFPDASAEHYLSTEDSVTVGEILLEQLCK